MPKPYPPAEITDPNSEEIAQRTAELARGLEALVWFQDWVTDVLAGAGVAEAGDDYKVTRERPASKAQWVTQAWALEDELHELLRAVGWKPWKETPLPKAQEVADENGDVLAFLGNILRYVAALPFAGHGIQPREMADAYARVTQRNVARYRGQVPGYDVPRSTKSAAVEDGAKSWLVDKTNGPLPGEQRPTTLVAAHTPEDDVQWQTDTSGVHTRTSVPPLYVPVPMPGLYRHFKGGTYEVLGTVQHSETRELMVRYRAVGGTEAYEQVRPAGMWSERVVELVNGTRYVGPRFVPH